MASPYKQDRGLCEFHTPLGDHEIVVRRFDAVEAISELFEYRVVAISHKTEPDFDKIIGRNCTVVLKSGTGDPRPV